MGCCSIRRIQIKIKWYLNGGAKVMTDDNDGLIGSGDSDK